MIENPAHLYLLSLGSKVSRDGMRAKLAQVSEMQLSNIDEYPWAKMMPTDIQNILAQLEDRGLSFSSVNTYLSALKGVAREAWRSGLMDGDVLARIKDIPNRRGSRLPAGQALAKSNVELMIQTCLSDPFPAIGKRNAAILAIGFYLGLRRFEIGQIKMAQLDLTKGLMRVVGKGNKERELPIPTKALPFLNSWISERSSQVIDYKIKGDFLFGGFHSRSNKLLALNGIHGRSILDMIKKIALISGINFAQLPTPHDMRRTAVTDWLDQGDPRIAQALAGHEHIQTTMSYSRSDLTDQMRVVVEK